MNKGISRITSAQRPNTPPPLSVGTEASLLYGGITYGTGCRYPQKLPACNLLKVHQKRKALYHGHWYMYAPMASPPTPSAIHCRHEKEENPSICCLTSTPTKTGTFRRWKVSSETQMQVSRLCQHHAHDPEQAAAIVLQCGAKDPAV